LIQAGYPVGFALLDGALRILFKLGVFA